MVRSRVESDGMERARFLGWERSSRANKRAAARLVKHHSTVSDPSRYSTNSRAAFFVDTSTATMYKFVALFALFACALAAPAPEPAPGFLAPAVHAAPVVAAAPVAVAHTLPVATSYANTYKVSVKSPLVAAAPYIAAPVATAAVVKTAAPIVAAAPAAAVYAHAPVVATY